jgi:hypothetical protein
MKFFLSWVGILYRAHRDRRERAAIQRVRAWHSICFFSVMIRKLPSGQYRLYSRKIDPRTHRRKNLGTFDSREAAEKHERAVQFFKRRG